MYETIIQYSDKQCSYGLGWSENPESSSFETKKTSRNVVNSEMRQRPSKSRDQCQDQDRSQVLQHYYYTYASVILGFTNTLIYLLINVLSFSVDIDEVLLLAAQLLSCAGIRAFRDIWLSLTC